jgi:hypothetical protein
MTANRRAGVAARALVTIGALLPYWQLLSFNTLFVTDDGFASDIFNGELPGRVLISRMLLHGQLPVWTSKLCSGMPLAGAPADPVGLALFSFLPTASALDAFVIVLLLIAAHGAYWLARRFGADRTGAVLAGIAFAGCGYIAAQLKHLGIVSTVVWLPIGLAILDRALKEPDDSGTPAFSRTPTPTLPCRALWLAAFAAVFAEQVLCGFPQSAYISGLVYTCFALYRVLAGVRHGLRWRDAVALLAGVGLAAAVAGAIGGIVLLPLSALGAVSDRAEALGWDWSTRLAYWPPNIITFVRPYFFGFIGNGTYRGGSIYWEDYGYLGLLPFVFGCYAVAVGRRRPIVLFLTALTVVAYFCVLGRATPVFHAIYLAVPGMKTFRFPTRFLIVVELGLALLGALGLTHVRAALSRHHPPVVGFIVALVVCVATIVDLCIYQPRQNPMVRASDWLEPPPMAALLAKEGPGVRTFNPRHRDIHRLAFAEAKGWADVTPYYRLRDVLDPNTGGALWNVASGDCYAAIAPRWYVDFWGDHNRELSLMAFLTGLDTAHHTVKIAPILPNVLRGFGVTHLLSPQPIEGAPLPLVAQFPDAYAYRIDRASRVRIVNAAEYVPNDNAAVRRLVDPSFDPDHSVILDDAVPPETGASPDVAASAGSASIVEEDARHLTVQADAAQDGYLVVADTFYPGWSAEVDGSPAPMYRANLSIRAVPVTKGHHRVRFEYEMPGVVRGAQTSLAGLSVLLLWFAGAVYTERRARR